MAKGLILVIDDEIHILELVKYNLEKEGYEVITRDNGEEGLRAIRNNRPALIVLDLMLPDIDGLEICKRIRSDNSAAVATLPVLMLTARGKEMDKVKGLEIGADDYLTKPFSIKELIARVKALLRRIPPPSVKPPLIRAGTLVIDTEALRVYKDEQDITLTNKEYELLKVLALNRGKILTRDRLLNDVWGYDYLGDTRTVDVHIRRLRRKIEDKDKKPKFIQTAIGLGYSFNYKGDQDA